MAILVKFFAKMAVLLNFLLVKTMGKIKDNSNFREVISFNGKVKITRLKKTIQLKWQNLKNIKPYELKLINLVWNEIFTNLINKKKNTFKRTSGDMYLLVPTL